MDDETSSEPHRMAVPNADAFQAGNPRAALVVVLAFDDVTLSDVAGPIDVFDMARRLLAELKPYEPADRYSVVVASTRGGPVRAASGLPIATVRLADLDAADIDTLIVPGGGPPAEPPIPADLVDWLARNGRGIRRVCAVCTGIFLIAEAGLADGKKVTTHWAAADGLAARYPAVIVDADPIFLRDGDLWSSAGFTAGLDVSLSLIEDDHGHDVAIRLARSLVMFIKRPGGQSQFSAPLAYQYASDALFEKLHAWMSEHLAEPLSVDRLAEQSGMTPRTFARRYTARIGRTPAKTIEMLRVEAACRHLLQSAASLKQIAAESGFGDEQNLRRTFQRHFGMSPQDYRARSGGLIPPQETCDANRRGGI